ncbi:hypothetical protein MKW98_024226 [Papaver atlanticum]|uniref:Coiled-coil domain-containing protein 22 homolog n=1 Tax=Papaver atlanticum TaxID=357466 RepID=A0AAD4XLE7_9MAGN|nr:hypothetical protein MKW98_024226 [Papaver atlanticum]
MDEAQEILINSLENSGISLPAGVFKIKDLTETALVSICSQSLCQIDSSLLFPTSLPDSMAERFKICSEISSDVKKLGYRGDMSFNQFLYPSEEDSYKLVRFLVDKLSGISEGGKKADLNEHIARLVVEPRVKEEVRESSSTASDELIINCPLGASLPLQRNNEPAIASLSKSESLESTAEDAGYGKEGKIMEKSSEIFKVAADSPPQVNDNATKLKQKLASLQARSSRLQSSIKELRSQETMLLKEVAEKTSESHLLEVDNQLLKRAIRMTSDEQHPVDFHVEDLTRQLESRRQTLLQLEAQWDAVEKSLLEKKRSLEESRSMQNTEVLEKLHKVHETEPETEAIRSEIKKREEELSRLTVELKSQPKGASRKSYIQRITEITKNSRKQDADIERILKETRELQLESNSIQDRLHRTFTVVDETVFRDAKKDPVRRQAYLLLTSIHKSFGLLSQKILATDRARRAVTEQEAKLAKMASNSLNMYKLQADLDAIRRENEFLEQRQPLRDA